MTIDHQQITKNVFKVQLTGLTNCRPLTDHQKMFKENKLTGLNYVFRAKVPIHFPL